MSTFKKVKLINPAGGDPVIIDVGATASNITFNDNSDLQSSFVPFTGASASTDGVKGLVPAPSQGDESKFLKADGTWETVPTVLTASLAANATTLTFTNSAIGDNTRIDVYSSVYGVNPTGMSQSGTTLTLTFPSSHSAASIKIHCWN